MDRLFVYGTLRAGQAARSLIADHVLKSEPAAIHGSIYALADEYPGFLPGGDGVVVGELMTLGDLASALALLDAYEGEDFVRALQEVTMVKDGSRTWAWCYVLARPELAEGAELVEGGDWDEYLRTR